MITAVTARLASGDFSALILANTGRGGIAEWLVDKSRGAHGQR
jgi:hypothetical protein